MIPTTRPAAMPCVEPGDIVRVDFLVNPIDLLYSERPVQALTQIRYDCDCGWYFNCRMIVREFTVAWDADEKRFKETLL